MFDRNLIKFLPLSERVNKISVKGLYKLNSRIPKYENPDLDVLAKRMVEARKKNKPVIWMMGAHVIRRGNSRFIIDLMERGIITHVATNGACVIHDFELAHLGATCEDVEVYIKDGKFGNWQETGFYINHAVRDGFNDGLGFGRSIGRLINCGWFSGSDDEYKKFFPHQKISIFAAAFRIGPLVTVHKSIGQDITDQHPSAGYAALGGASGRDFLTFADSVSKLEGGGVFLNLGTQVTGPEIYLKALSMARNVASQEGREIRHFTTAVFDIINLGRNWKKENKPTEPAYYFRPKKTILIRTVKDGGESIYVQGDFGVTVPNLYRRIVKLI